MINMLNKYSKILIGIVIGIVLSGIGVYAAFKVNASDISYNATSVADALDSMYQTMFSNNYSTTPKVVGKWLDCKPVYQQTFEFTTPTTQEGATARLRNNIGSDIDKVVAAEGYIFIGTTGQMESLFAANTEEARSSYFIVETDGTVDIFVSNKSAYQGRKAVATIQFTKNSDTATC